MWRISWNNYRLTSVPVQCILVEGERLLWPK